jgi:hypothetical protein
VDPRKEALGYAVADAGVKHAALLVNPNPTPAQILSATQTLEAAQTPTTSRTLGTVEARDPKETALRNLLTQWGFYLETIAANMPGQEAMVYRAGGFDERAVSRHVQEPLKVTQPGAPGTAHAVCKAAPKGKKAYYGWRISVDGGKSWTEKQTNDHMTDFANIPPGTEIEVQSQVTIKNVTSEWSTSAKLRVR